MLIGIIGYLGAGKTLLLTALLNKLIKTHMIITNYWTTFSDKVMNAEQMILEIDEFKHEFKTKKAFGIDELGTILKALEFYSDENTLLTDIARKSRKLNTDIYYTSQHIMMVDRNIRRITDLLLHVTCSIEKNKLYVEPYAFDGIQVHSGVPKEIKNIDRFFDLYNTNEIIEPNREVVINWFTEKAKINPQLMMELREYTRDKQKVDAISYYLKCSKDMSKRVLFRLSTN